MVALRRLYTPAEANKTLPLVRVIVRDVREVALRLRQTWSRVQAARPGSRERERLSDEMEDDRTRLAELSAELDRLGIELKDPLRGLIDFRALRGGIEVYLCWEFGEDHIDHWHPLDSGFAGRQPIDHA
jgi:hypothetical protein